MDRLDVIFFLKSLNSTSSNFSYLADELSCKPSDPWCSWPAYNVTCTSLEVACKVGPHCRSISSYSCDDYEPCLCPPLAGNADIAGTGALLGFLVTVGLAILLTILDNIFLPLYLDDTHNPIDRCLKSRLVKPFQSRFRQRARVSAVFSSSAQAAADTALVMGVAIMISLLVQYHISNIDNYHFELASAMAWTASINTIYIPDMKAEAAAVRAMNQKHWFQASWAKNWRVACFLMISGGLFWAYSVTAYNNWYREYSCPTKCIPKSPSEWGGSQMGWSIASIVMLGYSIPMLLIGIYTGPREWWFDIRKAIVRKEEGFCQRLECSWLLRLPYKVLKNIFLGVWFLLASKFFNRVIFNIFWYFTAVINMFTILEQGRQMMSPREVEDEIRWAFGQVVPIVLLALPIMTAVDTYRYWKPTETEIELDDVQGLLDNHSGVVLHQENSESNPLLNQHGTSGEGNRQEEYFASANQEHMGGSEMYSESTDISTQRRVPRVTWPANAV